MARKPKKGGYIHKELIARAEGANRRSREWINTIVTTGPTQSGLYQMLTAIAVELAAQNDILRDMQRDIDLEE
jgi:hypothetical protein